MKGSLDIGLVFKESDTDGGQAAGHVDLDYVGDLDNRRSTKGYIFTLFGGAIS